MKQKKLNRRAFLEDCRMSDSWYHVEDSYGTVSLKIADCNRQITWDFDAKGSKRGKKKIKLIKKIIDELYDYMHED